MECIFKRNDKGRFVFLVRIDKINISVSET